MTYLTLIIYLLSLAYIYDYKQYKKNRSYWYILTLLFFILLAGLRYRLGGDSISYMEYFKQIPTLDSVKWQYLNTNFQPLWNVYLVFLKSISSNFVILQFSNAVILNVAIFSVFKRSTRNIFTGLLIYFLLYYMFLNFETLREAMAVAVFLYGFKFWEKKKWVFYFIFCIIAFNFHVSAVICFIFPLFRNLKINIKWATIIIIALSVFSNVLFLILKDYILMLSLLNSNLKTNISGYITGIEEVSYSLKFVLFTLFENVIIPLLFLTIYLRWTKENRINNQMFFIHLVILSFSSLFFIISRFSNYTFVFYLIFLSDFIIYTVRKYKSFPILLFIILLVISPKLYLQTKIDDNGFSAYCNYYPYHSIITKKTDVIREKKFLYDN